MAASALTALVGGAAYASPEAGIDALIRPRFGVLLDPPLHRHHYNRPYGRGAGYGYRNGQPYGPNAPGGWEQTETVDCGDASLGPTPLSDALYRLADHGTLFIRGNSQACHESLYITRPVIIAGEPASAFQSRATTGPSAIAPPDGNPCITIQSGVSDVEIRDVTLLDHHGGGHACIESWDAAVALVRTEIRYGGDGSAIYISGGQLLAKGLGVTSSSYDPAVVTEGAAVDIQGALIVAASTGVEITPTAGGGAKLSRVSILAESAGVAGATAESGVIVRAPRGGPSNVEIENTRVSGFDTGLVLQQGSTVEVEKVKITRARLGIVSEAPRLEVKDSVIGAARSGGYVIRGHATFRNNRFFGFGGLPIDVEPGAEVEPRPWADNLIYPAGGCRRYEVFERWCRHSEEMPPPLQNDEGPGMRGWDGFPFEPPHEERRRGWFDWGHDRD